MAREPIHIRNDKHGFRVLLAIECLITLAMLYAAIRAARAGGGRLLSAAICLAAMVYITLRSFRRYRALRRAEKTEGKS